MPRLKDDLLTLMLAAVGGTLDTVSARWSAETALTVVLCANGYPGEARRGGEIRGLDAATRMDNVEVFHAGTLAKDGKLLAHGGRVLNVTGLGRTIAEARERAYAAVDAIDWPDGFCRRDIGWRALSRHDRSR
jgi:phosphoribosylamine--glycine ligase